MFEVYFNCYQKCHQNHHQYWHYPTDINDCMVDECDQWQNKNGCIWVQSEIQLSPHQTNKIFKLKKAHLDETWRPQIVNKQKKTLQKANFRETKPLKPTWKKKDLKAPVRSLHTNFRSNKTQSHQKNWIKYSRQIFLSCKTTYKRWESLLKVTR